MREFVKELKSHVRMLKPLLPSPSPTRSLIMVIMLEAKGDNGDDGDNDNDDGNHGNVLTEDGEGEKGEWRLWWRWRLWWWAPPDVRGISWNVVLRAGVKVLLRAFNRGHDSLVLGAQLPPLGVVICARDVSAEHPPPPLVDQKAKRKERHLPESHLHQGVHVGFWWFRNDVSCGRQNNGQRKRWRHRIESQCGKQDNSLTVRSGAIMKSFYCGWSAFAQETMSLTVVQKSPKY